MQLAAILGPTVLRPQVHKQEYIMFCTRHLFTHAAGEGSLAFCSGGDQSVRGKGGYVGEDSVPRLNVLDLQMQIRRLPKPVVAMVAGYAVGGGHILHMVCDLTVSSWQPCATQRLPAGQLPQLRDKQLVDPLSALTSCATCASLGVVAGLCQH
jgi:hypothetical protein